ncbi:unnamed protein product [Schistosoma spindalis]|nr:unnamed protein product [Schistosoma spindale]
MMTEIQNKGKAEIFTYENHDDSTDCSEDPDSHQEPNFGLLFDIDGVLGRGLEVLPQAAEAFKLLCYPDKKELRVPVALVTNGSGDAATKVQMVSKWFGININNPPKPKPMKRIEAIILTGEPAKWETSLQLLVDLLMTDGKPDEVPETFPEEHLPIIACNMDLVYMDKAALPRFGHGAFLICLQTLYNQLTGYKLRYTSLLGKPSEITFRFAEHILTLTSKRMGYKRPIDRLFFFGDNPDVDVLGSNLYNNFLRRFRHVSGGDKSPTEGHSQYKKVSVAQSRTVPPNAAFLPQTAKGIDSVLVRTGVYKPTDGTRVHYCHRDFQGAADLVLPTFEVEDCLEGVQLILNLQKFHPDKPIAK